MEQSIKHKRGEQAEWCVKCGKYYKWILLHQQWKHLTRHFQCDQCDKTFTTGCIRDKHIARTHLRTRNVQCDKCDKKFHNETDVKLHDKQVHCSERPYVCLVCNNRFKRVCNLYEHKRTTHSSERHYQCVVCDKRYKNKKSMKRCTLKHKGEDSISNTELLQTYQTLKNPPKSDICPTSTNQKTSEISPMALKLAIGIFPTAQKLTTTKALQNNYSSRISITSKQFTLSKALENTPIFGINPTPPKHTKYKACLTTPKDGGLSTSSKHTTTDKGLQNTPKHVLAPNYLKLKTTTSNGGMKKPNAQENLPDKWCRLCCKEFVSKSDLRRHIERTHEPTEKTASCDICPMQFHTLPELDRHKTIHMNLRFPCPDENCGTIRSSQYSINHHFKSVHGTVKHKKDPKELAKKREQRRPCKLCGALVKSLNCPAYNMKLHLRSHERQASLECPIDECHLKIFTLSDTKSTYNLPFNFYVHMSQLHQIEPFQFQAESNFDCLICNENLILRAENTQHCKSYTMTREYKVVSKTGEAWGASLKSHLIKKHEYAVDQLVHFHLDWDYYFTRQNVTLRDIVDCGEIITCELCKKVIYYRNLTEHMESKHSDTEI